jgi:hypothetical protein
MKTNYNPYQFENVFPSYRENQPADANKKAFFHTNLESTLENIKLEEKSIKEKGLLEKAFTDKSKTSKAGVKAMLEEIKLRESLNSHLLNKIDDGISKQNTELLQLDNIRYPGSFDFEEEIKKKKIQFKDSILELEKEKRKEYLECWKDLMFLKKYLLSSLKDYWNHARKRDVLEGDIGELMD